MSPFGTAVVSDLFPSQVEYLQIPILFLTLAILIFFALMFFLSNIIMAKKRVFLVDFACYKPPEPLSCSRAFIMDKARKSGRFSEMTLDFMQKTMERSGIGDSSYLPEGMIMEPSDISLKEALRETRSVMFGAVREVLQKTGLEGSDIKILIVNCCVFCASPSLSAMIVNEFKLRNDVISYNLQGMGCSAGLAAIGLAKSLLQVHSNSCALVLSTENLCDGIYEGDDRSMILINCLFRVGGAAVLLSNRLSSRSAAKYELIHTVQTQTANSDRSYNCIIRKEDEDGETGISISKDLLAVAKRAIEINVISLGGLILPLMEQLKYAINNLIRYFHVTDITPYNPNFKKAIDHICCHVGAKPVLDEIQKNLRLTDLYMEASRMTLYRFGNTSSSSVWYELAYIEAKGRMKKGDRVWQIAFGSGFKCNSVIWRAIRAIKREQNNPWSAEIGGYPLCDSVQGLFPYHFETAGEVIP
ncbi:hypothetical protein SAY86_007898 [Trapa natans]|uniref:3-ketoacyl-CoA synthase n=1 Tax=Trapa natans TaxID=22666 RepID=A0AAN7LFW9_TRANT|nr:hypothetical protein SAY86_007898 [Trapa natans]